MKQTIESLSTIVSLLECMGDYKGMNYISLGFHGVPEKYADDFESISDALSTGWRSVGVNNTWLDVKMPGLEVKVWFE